MSKMRAGVFVLLTGIGAPLRAQDTGDSVTFRRGQWGTEFGVAQSFRSIGVVRFSSTRDAWVVNGGFVRRTNDSEHPPYASEWEDRRGRVYAGYRWYRPLVSRVFRHVSTGVYGDAGRSESASGPRRGRSTMFGGGIFGELGGTWLATSHLALGAAWSTTLGHVRSSTTNTFPPDPLGPCQVAPCPDVITRYRSTYLQLGEVSLRVALYY